MSIYAQATLHAWRMLAALIISITFVLGVDIFLGHSAVAFALAIAGLVYLNRPMLRLNCPTCGKNLFFRGVLVVPWPNRICGKCNADLTTET